MTAETLIAEFESLAPAEQKKVFSYLVRRGTELLPSKSEQGEASDAEFEAALQKVMAENQELLRRLAQ